MQGKAQIAPMTAGKKESERTVNQQDHILTEAKPSECDKASGLPNSHITSVTPNASCTRSVPFGHVQHFYYASYTLLYVATSQLILSLKPWLIYFSIKTKNKKMSRSVEFKNISKNKSQPGKTLNPFLQRSKEC